MLSRLGKENIGGELWLDGSETMPSCRELSWRTLYRRKIRRFLLIPEPIKVFTQYCNTGYDSLPR